MIQDAGPSLLSPTDLFLENKGVAGTADQIAAPLNFLPGTDGTGSVRFNVAGIPIGVTSGVTVVATDGDGNQLTFGGQLLYLYYGGPIGDDTTILVAKTLAGVVGFTIDIDPVAGTYTFNPEGTISNGTEVTATNLTGVGAGNVPFKLLINVGGTSQDVAMTTTTGTTVNSDVDDIGIGGGQTFSFGEGIRFDLVNGLTLNNNNPLPDTYSYDGTHNQIARWKQTVFVGGNAAQRANIIVSAIVADADNVFYTDGDETKINLSTSNIRLYDASGLLIAPGSYAALGITVTDLGNSVQINGLRDDWSYEIITDDANKFSAVQVDAATGTSTFSLSYFTYGTDSAGTPIELSYDTVGTDRDGDSIGGTIDLKLYPDAAATTGTNLTGTVGDDILLGTAGIDTLNGSSGADILAGNGSGDTLSGGPGGDTLIGGAGSDTMTGGTGKDVFVIDADSLSPGIADVIVDYSGSGVLGDGDEIDLSALLDLPVGTTNLTGYVQLSGGNTLQVDTNGGGDNYETVATFSTSQTPGTIKILFDDGAGGTGSGTV